MIVSITMLSMACGDGAGEGPVLKTDSAPDLLTAEMTPEISPVDVPAQPDVWELIPQEVVEVADLISGCQPGDGCFLDPCEDGGDCLSGICVDHMGDTVCTESCVEECPEGWSCEQVGTGPDVGFACISPFTHLCRPCHTSADCKSPTGVEDVCVEYGGGENFCGAFCDEHADCPAGYSCIDSVTAEGGALKQCTADSGLCACSKKATALALTTPCLVENEWGSCHGLRTCTAGGLSACDALTPSEELCDGTDNDCDGAVDDVDCNDDNSCTEDVCDPDQGCVSTPLTGTDCNDSDVCTLADHCVEGECVGTTIDCQDENPCTIDSCDPSGGCIYTFNTADCDDDDPCTVADECALGQCKGFQVACDCVKDSDCGPLEDGDVCNGTLVCDTASVPHLCSVDPGTIIECDEPEGPGFECLAASCHSVTGECSLVSANDGQACDDGDQCTVGESCLEGVCGAGVETNCTDGNPCTTDLCAPESGCIYENNDSPCQDGDLCTVGDQCSGGECLGGEELACEDGNPCTDDACQQGMGCVHVNNVAPCDDLNSCTTDDQCLGGQCVGSGSLECDDGNPCTKDICLPDGGCSHENSATPCSDGDPCTVGDSCVAGQCAPGQPLDCGDGNPCTDDACDEGLCQHSPNQQSCDDGNPCTVGDHCSEGACVVEGPAECDDDNPCTTDWCDPLDGCVFYTNTLPCNDDDLCTTGDVCADGACISSGSLNCDDGNPCTDEQCDSESGCVWEENSLPCDDDNECTTGDTCSGGACLGTGQADCGDGNPCTDDQCDPQTGCWSGNNTLPCNDGDACSLYDVCADGECAGSASLSCNDGNLCTDDSCDAVAGCLFQTNTLPCDDGNACTINDECAAGVCVPGPAPDCDDANECTTDVCLWDSGCEYYPAPAGAYLDLCLVCDGAGEPGAPADDADCGELDCDELDYLFTSGDASAEETNYCMRRDYADLVNGRCKDVGQCKEENGADCTSFEDVVVATCGPCAYAEGECEQCTAYPDETTCGPGKWCLEGECVTNPYGDGADGDLVVSSANVQINKYSCIGVDTVAAGETVLNFCNATGFVEGMEIMVIQMQHESNAGTHEFRTIASVDGNFVTLAEPLENEYFSGNFNTAEASAIQIVDVPHYANVTVQSGASISISAWEGYTGGIVVFRASGTVEIAGGVTVQGKGFRPGKSTCCKCNGYQGEGWCGTGIQSTAENCGGGGGSTWSNCSGDASAAGSGGGGYAANGQTGTNCNGCGCGSDVGGEGGGAYGAPGLSGLFFGAGSGSGGRDNNCGGSGAGGAGGGIIRLFAKTINVSGSVNADGADNSSSWGQDASGPSSGAGGSIHLTGDTVNIGSNLVTAKPGKHGYTHWCCGAPVSPSAGRIRLDYETLNGSTNPVHYEE